MTLALELIWNLGMLLYIGRTLHVICRKQPEAYRLAHQIGGLPAAVAFAFYVQWRRPR